MRLLQVPEGALFYGKNRRRTILRFDDELRALTANTAAAVREMLAQGHTPPPVPMAACRRCSLEQLCRPKAIAAFPQIGRWLARQIAD